METNHMNDSNSVSAGVDVDDDDDQGDFDVIVWHWLQKKNRLNAIATLVATASQTTVDDPRILPRVLRTLALYCKCYRTVPTTVGRITVIDIVKQFTYYTSMCHTT